MNENLDRTKSGFQTRNTITAEFLTASIGLAAYINYIFPVIRVDIKKDANTGRDKNLIVFENSESLQQLVYEWDNREAKVEPRDFLDRYYEFRKKYLPKKQY